MKKKLYQPESYDNLSRQDLEMKLKQKKKGVERLQSQLAYSKMMLKDGLEDVKSKTRTRNEKSLYLDKAINKQDRISTYQSCWLVASIILALATCFGTIFNIISTDPFNFIAWGSMLGLTAISGGVTGVLTGKNHKAIEEVEKADAELENAQNELETAQTTNMELRAIIDFTIPDQRKTLENEINEITTIIEQTDEKIKNAQMLEGESCSFAEKELLNPLEKEIQIDQACKKAAKKFVKVYNGQQKELEQQKDHEEDVPTL